MKHICECGNEHEVDGVDVFDPEICPSSLDEFDRPMTEGETAHKWDDTTDPITCAECGTTKECEYCQLSNKQPAQYKNDYGKMVCEQCA